MPQNIPPSSTNPPPGRLPLSPRVVAIGIMLIGAAGFAVSVVVYGDQVLCLFGSTLITFLGLGILLVGRRGGFEQWGIKSESPGQTPINQPIRPPAQGRARMRRDIPRGLRTASAHQTPEAHHNDAQFPAADLPQETEPDGEIIRQTQAAVRGPFDDSPAPDDSQPPEKPLTGGEEISTTVEPPQPHHPPAWVTSMEDEPDDPPRTELIDQVLTMIENAGAGVTVETRRLGRAILRIAGSDGQSYAAIVHAYYSPVDVPDVRALRSLIVSGGCAGGYLFSAGPFTQAAYDWAGSRQIRLVMADELDEINL